ncbi:hypothetical protein CRX72_13575 [Pantoea sp. BRM17]|nr:hypothetical protein CRX72_13575 [Pantoea sp. BRM17]
MNYHIIPVTAFSQNCSAIWDEETGIAALVDPGGDAETIKAALAERGLKPSQILLTHGHLDHAGAKHSYHTKGQAMDFHIEGIALSNVRKAALSMRAGGVGYYPRSNFVHIDTGPARHWS